MRIRRAKRLRNLPKFAAIQCLDAGRAEPSRTVRREVPSSEGEMRASEARPELSTKSKLSTGE